MIGPAVFNATLPVGTGMAVKEIDRVEVEAVRPVILLVDDDLSGLEKLRQTLEESYTVQTAISGVAAIHEITVRPEIDVPREGSAGRIT